jgi:hypothetical protein
MTASPAALAHLLSGHVVTEEELEARRKAKRKENYERNRDRETEQRRDRYYAQQPVAERGRLRVPRRPAYRPRRARSLPRDSCKEWEPLEFHTPRRLRNAMPSYTWGLQSLAAFRATIEALACPQCGSAIKCGHWSAGNGTFTCRIDCTSGRCDFSHRHQGSERIKGQKRYLRSVSS